jgi:hypothetical protein
MRKIIGIILICFVFPACASGNWENAPIIPKTIKQSDIRTSNHLAFSKAGDSISYMDTFLQGFGCGPQKLGKYGFLRETINTFRKPVKGNANVCNKVNSFSRNSIATKKGMTISWVINSGSLKHELKIMHPNYVFVMFGTNDVSQKTPFDKYRASIQAIVDISLRYKTLPIFYTIPPRLDDLTLNSWVEGYNSIVYQVAQNDHVPIINFWRALQNPSVINKGIVGDGVHLNVFDVLYDDYAGVIDGSDLWRTSHQAVILTAEALRYGTNIRNFLTLQTLQKLVNNYR